MNIYKRFFFVLILTLFISQSFIFPETAEIKTDYAFAKLSALLPGSGQVYAGNYKKGLYSFLINASLIGATAYSLDKDEKLSGALFFVIDLPFYYKNIRAAISYAKQYNENSKKNTLKQIEKNIIGMNIFSNNSQEQEVLKAVGLRQAICLI